MSREELTGYIEELPLAIAVIAEDGVLRYMNKAFEVRFGVARADSIGFRLPELIGLEHVDYDSCMARVTQGQPWNGRWIGTKAEQQPWILDVVASPIRAQELPGDGCMLMIRDLSESDTLAERMRDQTTMSVVNRLAAGVAHEINNPLSFILGNVVYLSEEFDEIRQCVDPTIAREWSTALHDLEDGVERIRDIVRQLGGLVNDVGAGMTEVAVDSLLDATLAIVRTQICHKARLVRDYSPCGPVWANASSISHIILNLLLNAIDSMDARNADTNELKITLKPDPMGRVHIEVRDTGTGISDDVLPHIFEPFFSTRPVGSGTGMGLTIARRLVEELGGYIAVRSKIGNGTSFIVSLPAAGGDGAVPIVVPVAMTSDEYKGEKRSVARVLVIDDEIPVLRMIERILAPHDVVSCGEGKEALRLIEQGDFDVIFCDLMMSEVSGEQLYNHLRAINPKSAERIVFMTGGAFLPDMLAFSREVENELIAKPFAPKQIRKVVARMMG